MIKLFESFCGYGGGRWSLIKSDIPYKSIGYSEIKKAAIKIYDKNFPNTKNYGDITKIDENNLPDFDILTGGFPCTDVSISGKNDLTKGRTTLFNDIIRIIKVKKPRYLLLENVKGLLQQKHKEFYEHVVKSLEESGYYTHIKVLNTKDYGVPQSRERVYFVCFKNKDEYDKFMWPEKEELKLKVTDLLDNNPRSKVKNKRMDKILNSPTGKENPCFELKNDTPSKVSRQSDRIYSTICPTLNCTLKENKFWINNEVIVLTGKEQMRLQGFINDEINLEGLSENEIKDLSGDGWSINVTSRIIRNMLKEDN